MIEWSTGPSAHAPAPAASSQSEATSSVASSSMSSDVQSPDASSSREQRRARRDRIREAKEKENLLAKKAAAAADSDSAQPDMPALYVAYHDWEHFSSVRNLTGPHQGVPNVCETTAPSDVDEPPAPAPTSSRRPQKAPLLKPPSQIADVRSPSPSTTTATTSTQNTELSSSLSSGPPRTPPDSVVNAASAIFSTRSPKRSFDESDENLAGGEASGSEYGRASSKRTRARGLSIHQDVVVGDDNAVADDSSEDEEGDEEGEESAGESSSVYSSSAAPSPVPPERQTRSARQSHRPSEGTLTKRQRKSLNKQGIVSPGRPKPKRVILLLGKKADRAKEADKDGSKGSSKDTSSAKDGKAEWMSNGTGKMDVRGFRELKI